MTEVITRPTNRDWEIAYHEAGHAIVAYFMRHLFGELKCCTIEPETIHGVIRNGHCLLAPTPLMAARERPAGLADEQWQSVVSLDELRVEIYLAGFMAEAIHADKSRAVGQSALIEATKGEDHEELELDLQKEEIENSRLPQDYVTAYEILRCTAKESEIEERLSKLNVDVALMLLGQWAAVEAIAGALIEKRSLSGEEVGTIVESALAQIQAENSLALPSISVVA